MTYPNARDCEHGRQRGKCPECDVIELESENARLRGIVERANEIAHRQYSHSELMPIIEILNEAGKGEQ